MTLTNAPILESENLILRGPEKKDAEKVISFLIDESRSWGFGSSPDRSDAWRWFSTNVGHWHWHGYGYFIIETNVGEVAGLSGIWIPDGWPEPEVGWAVFDSFEGKSIAYEAACRARRWAYDELEFTTLTSGIVPNNQRSINLAKRMGAYFERSYTNLFMGEEMLFRHPKPHELHK